MPLVLMSFATHWRRRNQQPPVVTALTFTQNEFLPQAHTIMDRFKRQMEVLESQLNNVYFPTDGPVLLVEDVVEESRKENVAPVETVEKNVRFGVADAGVGTTMAPERAPMPFRDSDTAEVVEDGSSPQKPVLRSLVESTRTPKTPRTGSGPSGTYGSYPSWWGHAEHTPQKAMDLSPRKRNADAPPPATTSPKKMAGSIANVMQRMSTTSPTKQKKQPASLRKQQRQEPEKPWSFPKRMVDEAVQATESMAREQYERLALSDMREAELRKAARRVDHNLDAVYTEDAEIAQLERGQFSTGRAAKTPEYEARNDNDESSTTYPLRHSRRPVRGRQLYDDAVTKSAPAKTQQQPLQQQQQEYRAPVVMSFSPPPSTRKHTTRSPAPHFTAADSQRADEKDLRRREMINNAVRDTSAVKWNEMLESSNGGRMCVCARRLCLH